MGEQLYSNSLAEKEANDIGEKFMNSGNVLDDMSAAYGVNLRNKVRFHNDSSSYARVKRAHRDAVTVGNDVFFGEGVLDHKSPETNALVAHEVAHTMQQSGEGGVSVSSPAGSSQGGILDFFKSVGRGVAGFFAPRKAWDSDYVRKRQIQKNSNSVLVGELIHNDSADMANNESIDRQTNSIGNFFSPINRVEHVSHGYRPEGEMLRDVNPIDAKADYEVGARARTGLGRMLLGTLATAAAPIGLLGSTIKGAISGGSREASHNAKSYWATMKDGLPYRALHGVVHGIGSKIYHGFGFIKNSIGSLFGKGRGRDANNAIEHLSHLGPAALGFGKNGWLSRRIRKNSGADTFEAEQASMRDPVVDADDPNADIPDIEDLIER